MGHVSRVVLLMGGRAARQGGMLTAVTPDALAPQHHPIRRIKPMVDRALAQLSPTFDGCTRPTVGYQYRQSTH